MKRLLIAYLLTIASMSTLIAAPSPEPFIAYAYPAGGSAGTSIRISVAGQSLKGADTVIVSGKGVAASVLSYTGSGGPLSNVQEEELKRRLEELVRVKSAPGKAATISVPAVALPDLPDLKNLEGRTIAELRALGEKYLNRNIRPKAPMNEIVEVELAIDPQAEPGRRELRILAAGGISNPAAFIIGTSPEALEPDRFMTGLASNPEPYSPPCVINGQIFPGEVDNFKLTLNKGDTIECAVQARSLIPYLADAVPGWFQAVLTVFDPEGLELAYSDDFGSDPDPRLSFTAKKSGVHTVQIRDSIYRGRFDFVYRIAIQKASSTQKPVLTAQKNGITGIIAKAGKIDSYRYEGKAGDTFVAEIRARRDGSPLDAALSLKDPAGATVAFNDDFEDKESGLLAHHADPYLRYRLAQSGTYTLQVADVNNTGGPGHFYSLRLGQPSEDFALLSDRSAINIPMTGSAVFSVLAVRKDGWEGDIEIVAKNPLPGLSIEGGTIPKGRDSSRMTVSFKGISPAVPYELQLEGRGMIRGIQVSRPVKPADRMMQAFANLHYVPAEALYLGFARGKVRISSIGYEPASVRIPAGGSAEVKVSVSPLPGPALASVALELVDPPAGLQLKESTVTENGFAVRIFADAKLAGTLETLILRASATIPGQPARTVDIGILPALRVEIYY